MTEVVTEAEVAKPWWSAGRRRQITVADDPDVPGGVVLTPHTARLRVPSGSPAFSIALCAHADLEIALTEPLPDLGVVVTGESAGLTLVATEGDDADVAARLRVLGRAPDGGLASVNVAAAGRVSIELLEIESAAVTSHVQSIEVDLQDATYRCTVDNADGSSIPSLVARGRSTIELRVAYQLRAEPRSRISICGVSTVTPLVADEDSIIRLEPGTSPDSKQQLTLGSGSKRARVLADKGIVRLEGDCDDVVVAGGAVEAQTGAWVAGRDLQPGSSPPVLTLRPRSAIDFATGVVQLGRCEHARLTGADESPLLIDSVEPTPNEDDGPWTDAIIAGVRVPAGLRGVPVLLAARDTAIFNPDLDGLTLGLTYKKWWRRLARQLPLQTSRPRRPDSYGQDQPLLLNEVGHTAELLADVIADKSTEGSTRTTAAWCGYRYRQVTASSFWERLVLTAYRPLGFAQRPGPPLVLWLLVTAVAVPVVAVSGRIEPTGWSEWLKLVAEVLFLPFQFLRLNPGDGTEMSKIDPVYLVPLRVALTLPFGFAVLAIRQFVKAGNP